jgi:hypothetical protein
LAAAAAAIDASVGLAGFCSVSDCALIGGDVTGDVAALVCLLERSDVGPDVCGGCACGSEPN